MVSKVKLTKEDGALRIVFNWSRLHSFFMFFTGFAFLSFTFYVEGPGDVGTVERNWIPAIISIPFFYVGLCHLVNKTTIQATKTLFTIKHGPLLFTKVNREIEVKDISQFYVMDEAVATDYKTEHTCELRVKLKDEDDISLVSDFGLSEEQLVMMEQELERFLGIPDFYVIGEYKGEEKKKKGEARRRIWAKIGSEEATMKNLQLGTFLDFNNHKYKVAHITQYDWTHGNTDRLFHLKSETGYEPEQFLHIRKHYSSYYYFLERELTPVEIQRLKLDWETMPSYFDYEGNSYFRVLLSKGTMYQNEEQDGLPVEEWKYKAGDEYHIRVLNNAGFISYFTGQRTDDAVFSNIVNP